MFARTLFRFFIIGAVAVSLPACQNLGKKKQDYAASDGDYVSGTPLPERQEGVSFLGSNVDRSRVARRSRFWRKRLGEKPPRGIRCYSLSRSVLARRPGLDLNRNLNLTPS